MMKTLHVMKYFLFLIILFLALSHAASTEPLADRATARQLQAIQKYIKQSWHTLTRSNAQLAHAAVDPKFHPPQADSRWPVYVSKSENLKRIEQSLRAEMKPEDFARIELRALSGDAREIREPGLLYLPFP